MTRQDYLLLFCLGALFSFLLAYGGELTDLCPVAVRIELENKLDENVAQGEDGKIVLCDYCKRPATIFVMACTEISKFCTQHSHLSKKK